MSPSILWIAVALASWACLTPKISARLFLSLLSVTLVLFVCAMGLER